MNIIVLLQKFQSEIERHARAIEHVNVAGHYLIQKSEPSDAVDIFNQLIEFNLYCEEVLGRLNKYQARLHKISMGQVSGKGLHCSIT